MSSISPLFCFAGFSAKICLWNGIISVDRYPLRSEEWGETGEGDEVPLINYTENVSFLFKRNADINLLEYVTTLCNQLYW